MRYIIYGAGAVGGALGAELALSGAEVVLVARGAHKAAIESDGLEYVTPEDSIRLRLEVVERATEIEFRDENVVFLATKSQDTDEVLSDLVQVAPARTPIVCAQNGVANEDAALRRFPNVYGACVVVPAAHLRPGLVVVHASPRRGIFHIGRYPHGEDSTGNEIVAAISRTGFEARGYRDVRPYKYTKLLSNLANSAQALLEPAAVAAVASTAREEGRATYRAAGINYAPEDAFARANAVFSVAEVAGHQRPGGSTWQSLARSAGSIESDYLNGEIVLLGRQHGVPTPVNELLRLLSNEAARNADPPGRMSEARFVELLARHTPDREGN